MDKRTVLFILFSSTLSPRHLLMIKALKLQGWRVSVIAWDRSGDATTNVLDCVDDWRCIHLQAPTWNLKLLFKLPQYYLLLWKELSKRKTSSLLVVSHYMLLPFVIFCDGEKIYDAAEMYSIDMSFYFGPLRHVVRPLLRLIEGVLVSRADGVLTVDSKSGWLKKFYERWNRRVQVIWNVPSKLDDPDPKEVEAVKSAYSGRKIIAFVGGLMREKGLRVAIEAAAKINDRYPEVLFLFIGPMKDDCGQVEDLISKKCVGDQIKILSSMPYTKMMAHLVHAEIGLALYQNKLHYNLVSTGNGRKFFTYMQAGLAIVGPQFSEVGKAVELANCGMLVDTEDAGAVSGAILDLLDAPEKLKRYKQNARSAFETQYNWEKEEPKLLRFLEKVVA